MVALALGRFGNFTANDLIVVFGGNNDAFVQFGTFAARAAQVQADAQAGRITSDQAQQLLPNAQLAGSEEMNFLQTLPGARSSGPDGAGAHGSDRSLAAIYISPPI